MIARPSYASQIALILALFCPSNASWSQLTKTNAEKIRCYGLAISK